MLQTLVQQSAGGAIGVFVGTLIGFSVARRRKPDMKVLGDSVFIGASAAGGVGLIVLMAVNYIRMTM